MGRPGGSKSRSHPASGAARAIRVAGKGTQGSAGGKSRRPLPGHRTSRRTPRFEAARRRPSTRRSAPRSRPLLLGGEAHVTTRPDGRTLALSIPAHTQDGSQLPAARSGDATPREKRPPRVTCTPRFHAELPSHLSERERELLEEFQRAGAGCRRGGAIERRDDTPARRPTARDRSGAGPRGPGTASATTSASALLTPRGSRVRRVFFSESAMARMRKIRRLHDDLGLDRAGVEGGTPSP